MLRYKLDVIIFGATGFTGKYVVQEFVRIAHKEYTWAVAGRNYQKLTELLSSVSAKTGEDLNKVPIIVADCADQNSLNEMASQGKIVINCCGPYRFYGNSVVSACIDNGTHHVDVSGEPEYMEMVQLKYGSSAEQKGVYIVSACGFDSVPVDLGVIFFSNKFEGVVNSIESYMKYSNSSNKFVPLCNYATWESAVHGFANASNLISLRKELYSQFERPKLQPRLPNKPTVHKSELFGNKYSIPFPGSDRSVVNRSQMLMHRLYKQRPIQYNAFLICDTWIVLIGIMIVGYFLQMLTKYEFGKKLLLRFPEFFSLGMMTRGGVPEEAARNSLLQIKFQGEGWTSDVDIQTTPPNKRMITEFKAENPAYGFTSTCVILCALTIIKETSKLPPKGGVYTPASAFGKTTLLEKLINHGVSFKVLDVQTK